MSRVDRSMFVANVGRHLCRYHFLQCGPEMHLLTLGLSPWGWPSFAFRAMDLHFPQFSPAR